MAIVYLTPEDLTPGQTNEVLAFLNSVQTAEEIAERIEIPDELDVGVRVGQHILDYRSQLPEGFTDLEQLMDVYQVGPERFTEIVSVVLGIPLPQFTPLTLETLIQREVAAQVKSAPRQPTVSTADQFRIAIQPPSDLPWVGQEMPLGIKVLSAATGRPVANLPVTVESHDMWISTQFGYEIREGQVISSRTASDGSLRLRLRNIFDERLTVDQFSALQEALRHLDTDATAPRDIRGEFLQLVALYEDVRNKRLRAAMDIIYRSTGKLLSENLNHHDYLYQWKHHTGLLRVYLDADTQTLVQPTPIADATAAQVGIYNVQWRQWLMPWYQVYLEQLSGNNLQQTFVDAKEHNESEAGVTAAILGQAYRFVAGKNGLIGEALGKRVIGKEIQRFLAKEITSYPAHTQKTMYPSLLLAGNAISSADTGTLALVNQTRVEMESTFDKRLSDKLLNNDEILGSIGQLNTRIDKLNGQLDTQNGRYSELQLEVNDLKGEVETMDASLVNVQGNIVQINTELERIDSNVLQLDTNFQQINTDFEQLELDLRNIDTRVTDINTSVNQLDTRFDGLNVQVTGLNNQVSGLNTQITGLDSQLSGLDTQISGLDTKVSGIDTKVSGIDTKVSGIDTRVSGLDTQVAGMDTRVAGLDTQVSGLDSKMTTLNKDAVLKTDITRDAQGNFIDIRNRPIRG
ncbi:methyl-accepting chemotaxis protein [Hahella ganghwensis]|uniref:methyl-accepting chemotaxis protein n=1 Tax=Hahella ganghwensis TaxID=286420 RepID=UPI0003787284|nr:methyl-accepting chemotaxis protein [Hahella ganghwensis]